MKHNKRWNVLVLGMYLVVQSVSGGKVAQKTLLFQGRESFGDKTREVLQGVDEEQSHFSDLLNKKWEAHSSYLFALAKCMRVIEKETGRFPEPFSQLFLNAFVFTSAQGLESAQRQVNSSCKTFINNLLFELTENSPAAQEVCDTWNASVYSLNRYDQVLKSMQKYEQIIHLTFARESLKKFKRIWKNEQKTAQQVRKQLFIKHGLRALVKAVLCEKVQKSQS